MKGRREACARTAAPHRGKFNPTDWPAGASINFFAPDSKLKAFCVNGVSDLRFPKAVVSIHVLSDDVYRRPYWAGVAQLVEHLICNQRVGGSSPFAGLGQV